MKKHITLIFLILIFSSTTLLAQDIYVGASYWDMDDAEEVVGGHVGVSLPFLLPGFKLDAKIFFFEDTEIDSENIELLPVDVGAQFHLFEDQDFHPYILAGVSFIYADADDIDLDSTLGAYAGGGLEYKLGLLRIYAEVMYRIAEVDKDTNVLEDDLDLNGLLGNAGLKVRF